MAFQDLVDLLGPLWPTVFQAARTVVETWVMQINSASKEGLMNNTQVRNHLPRAAAVLGALDGEQALSRRAVAPPPEGGAPNLTPRTGMCILPCE